MKIVVLDTNELAKDWLLSGLKYQLIEHMSHQTWMDFCVPAVVVEELVANHARAVARAQETGARLKLERARLGLGTAEEPQTDFDYREYLEQRFEGRLDFSVESFPTTPHDKLVHRAVNRIPPFDAKGGGYRDALVWEGVISLAREGRDVVLVSQDRAFAGEQEGLASALQAEVEPLPGTVELVRDFNRWLLSQLPWRSIEDLPTALAHSRKAEFYAYYLESGFQDDLVPPAEALGFSATPYGFEVVDVRWQGGIDAVDNGVTTDDGLVLVEYEMGQSVDFQAELPVGMDLDPRWLVRYTDSLGRAFVRGTVDLNVRVAVLFGGEFGFSIEELSWRRPDGASGFTFPVYRPEFDPNQPSLF